MMKFYLRFIEWMCLENMGLPGKYIGRPEAIYNGHWVGFYDTMKMVTYLGDSGRFKLTNRNGDRIPWNDVEEGMMVKIRAKNPNYRKYEYLHVVGGVSGKYCS